MNNNLHQAVRQVLKEASEHEHFFDFSDAERLNWMIERAYTLGKRSAGGTELWQLSACAGAKHADRISARSQRGSGQRKS